MRTSLILCPLGLLSACGAPEPSQPADRSPVGDAGNVERIADHEGCDDPRPWADHLTPSAEARGIDITLGSTPSAAHFHGFQTGVIAEDIDQDNDIDLVFWDGEEQLHLLLNDGGGNFEPSELPPAPSRENGQYLRAAAAGDIDGDGLPELLWVGDGIALASVNLGAGAFADWQTVIAQMGTQLDGYAAAAFGDIDGDDDLDVILAGLDARTAGASLPFNTTDWVASPDRILQNEGGTLVAGPTLVQFAGANLSLVQTITDRDLDGDVDLLSWADRADAMPDAPAAAFWRNDGGVLINDAMDIGADTIASAMGAGIADLNEDGRPDYCVTDISDRLTCLMSDGNGAYYEGAAALGLEVQRTAHPAWPGPDNIRDVYTGWGLQLVDLDNDGFLDAASTGSVVSMTLDLQQPVV
ncbi:MAG: VCBS repeat-containing protein, partial [Myxococcota bacterium]|nr:VCBS repeat-containing protein [Myxococcota bacterium]